MSGRLFHYAVDAALISTVFAGVKRSTGLTLNMEKIENTTVRSGVEMYLSFGEYCFGKVVETLKTSDYSKKDE
ncbi:hypothetical protein K7432_009743 [Basidiobolus ranarum]|uniref:DUF1748-domain-containing protein n=1 Tax=Basidiobolus ranarum TaxID=34480 RepID=A0ABR2VWK6_9FUNG